MLENSGNLKKIQKIQLEIFKEFKKICEKNKISYIVAYGTMLGAVRHNGFIPWDDDLDVAMTRSEYNRFLKVCQKELNDDSKFFIQNYETDQNFPHTFTRMCLKNTLAIQKSWQHANFEMPLFIDIFVYDYLPAKEVVRKIQSKLILQIMNLKRWKSGVYSNLEVPGSFSFKKIVYKFIKRRPFGIGIISTKRLNKWQDKIQQWGNNDIIKGKKLANFYMGDEKSIMESICLMDDFENTLSVKFEDIKVSVPKNYDKILTSLYGEYKQYPPEDERVGNHSFIKVKF